MRMMARAALAALLSISLAACSDDDSSGTPDGGGATHPSCPGTHDAARQLCTIQAPASSPIVKDYTLKKGITYVLDGTVFFGDDKQRSTLTIEAGTRIVGITGEAKKSALVIQRHAQIFANGTPTDPIVFTSAADPGTRAPGDWGGLVINGLAPVNGCAAGTSPCELAGEGETGTYGGDRPDDNSGVIKYVQIQFAGVKLTPKKEFNGIALQGVGSGTTIHHVQIHRASDDSVEFFGGTAQMKYVLATGCEDDIFDWTNGWTGKVQFFIGHQSGAGDHGIEADNLEDNHDAAPRANPTLYNFTLVGDSSIADGSHGVELRRGTAGTLRNFLVYGFKEQCFKVTDAATKALMGNSLTIAGSLVDADTCFKGDTATRDWFTKESTNKTGDPGLKKVDIAGPDYTPAAGSPALSGAAARPAGDSFIEDVDFIGGMGSKDNWIAGWTAYPLN